MEMLLLRKQEHRKEFIHDFSPAMPGNLREQAAGTPKQTYPFTQSPISQTFSFFKTSLTGSIPVSRTNSPRRCREVCSYFFLLSVISCAA